MKTSPTRQLLFSVTKDDFRIDYFRCSGHGGQKVNKTSSGVRITHPESGVVSECTETRSQAQNKKIAFKKLAESPKFQVWLKKKAIQALMTEEEKKQIEKKVDDWMDERYLKIEYF